VTRDLDQGPIIDDPHHVMKKLWNYSHANVPFLLHQDVKGESHRDS